MKRFLKRLCVLIIAGVVLLIVAVVIALLNLPPIAEKLITNKLESMGFHLATLYVESASLSEIKIGGIDFGVDTEVTIDQLHATYSLVSLWKGEVDTIEIEGLRWDIWVFPDRTDFGLGVPLPASESEATIPFRSLTISDSSIHLIDPDDQSTLQNPPNSQLNATFTRVGDTSISGTLSMQPYNMQFDASVAADLTQQIFESTLQVDNVESANLPVAVYEMLGLGADFSDRLKIDNGTLSLPLQINLADDSLEFSLIEAATLAADALMFDTLEFEDSVSIEVDANDALLTIPTGANRSADAMTHAAFGIQLTQPVSFKVAGNPAQVSSLTVDVEFDKAPGSLPSLFGRVLLDQASLQLPAADLAMQNISADLPIFYNLEAGEQSTTGFLAISSTTWQSQNLPPLQFIIDSTNNELNTTAAIAVHDEHDLEIIAGIEYHNNTISGEFVAYQPPAEFERFTAFGLLGSGESAWMLDGILALNSRLVYVDDQIDANLRFFLSDATLSDAAGNYTLKRISGSFALDSLSPLRTPGVQHLEFGGGRLGETATIRNGHIALSFNDNNTIRVDDLAVNLVDAGRFVMSPFTINPANLMIETTINTTNAKLSFWLPLLTNERATGDGMVDGFIDVILQPMHESRPIRVLDGSLVANPQTGWLVVDDASQLEQMLIDTDPRFAKDETMVQVKDRIISAMRDFAYDTLRVRFEPDGSDAIARVHVSGRGRQGDDPQEITLDLNVSGLQDAAAAVIPLSPLAELFGNSSE